MPRAKSAATGVEGPLLHIDFCDRMIRAMGKFPIGVGVLRLRETVRFAGRPAPLSMTSKMSLIQWASGSLSDVVIARPIYGIDGEDAVRPRLGVVKNTVRDFIVRVLERRQQTMIIRRNFFR